ncbi:hypothetical protein GV51_1197 [Gardnerella vaginalis 5-1]|nr:hypothetical protein GV51_1197 [Gardnerella vaginalis 5-1]
MVNTEHNCWSGFVLSRSRNKNLLSACIQVSLGLFCRSVETGAFENEFNAIVLNPWNVICVFFGVNLISLAIYNDCVFGGGYLNWGAVIVAECAVGAVILEQVGEHRRGGQIVDGCDFDVTCLTAASLKLKNTTECETTDATETINTNLDCHVVLP